MVKSKWTFGTNEERVILELLRRVRRNALIRSAYKSNGRNGQKVSTGCRPSISIPVYNEEQVILELLRRQNALIRSAFRGNGRNSERVSTGFRLSVAIPVYNEEQVILEVLRRVRIVLDEIPGGPHEMVLVDDGSSDRTFEIVTEAAAQDPRIVGISLSRNFGHQSAVSAALNKVTGDAVVVMDGDLQDSPEVIRDFIREYNRGFDVVYAQRISRKEGWLLRSCYFLFYRLLALFSNLRLPLDAGDFALLSRRVIDELRRLPEHHRYLRGLRVWVGFRQTGILVERSERFSGKSKYSFMKLLGLAFDGIFAFSVVPLRVASILGLLTILCSFVFVAYSIYVKVTLGQSPQGFTALIVVMTFLSGVQLLFLGVIGEYLGRVYEETKGRPHYVVGKIVGGAGEGLLRQACAGGRAALHQQRYHEHRQAGRPQSSSGRWRSGFHRGLA